MWIMCNYFAIVGNNTVILKCKWLSINDFQPSNSQLGIVDAFQAIQLASLFICGGVDVCQIHNGHLSFPCRSYMAILMTF